MTTRAPLRAPFTVCMWLTDYCNLDCTYCYAKPFSGGSMAPERALQLVDEFAAMGVFDITFAGGEPTAHPAWLELVRRSVQGGIRVGLLTNGVSLTNQEIAELERATTKENFLIQVSIDSLDPEINDAVRGKTRKVVETIERLAQSSLQVQLATVVHRKNLATAHTIIDRFYPHIKRFHFLNVQRTAAALANGELFVTEDEAQDFWLRLKEHATRFPADLFLPSLRVQMRTLGGRAADEQASLHAQATWECTSCSAGWTHINVTTRFDVLGCDIAKDHTGMGNCAGRPFEEVWHSRQAARVRNAPYPACYDIEAPSGERLADNLKDTFIPLSQLASSLISRSSASGRPRS